jgi:hypothetical protein
MNSARYVFTIALYFLLLQGTLNDFGYAQVYRGTGPKADQLTSQSLKESFGQGFNPSARGRGMTYYLVILSILGLLTAALIYLDKRYRQFQKDGYDNPEMLFRELCVAQQLTKVERALLKDIALELDLENSLPLFVDPQLFVRALTEPRFIEQRKTIKYLLGKFFDIHSEMSPRFLALSEEGQNHSESSETVPSDAESSEEVGVNTTLIYPARQS